MVTGSKLPELGVDFTVIYFLQEENLTLLGQNSKKNLLAALKVFGSMGCVYPVHHTSISLEMTDVHIPL
jgi:hypothetical protein